MDKGQTISEWIYEVIVSPKIRTKFVKISALTTQGRNPDNFSLVFSEKQWLHKFILKLSDLGCDFRLVIDLYFSIRKFMNIQWVCTQAKRWRQAVSHQKPRVVAARALQGLQLQCMMWLCSRCGRVMADNIAYAKFRKTLLKVIWTTFNLINLQYKQCAGPQKVSKFRF